MVVCKILWVCMAVVAMKARESQSYGHRQYRKDCRCFPTVKNSVRISTLADKYGKHERKVIYLFKHPDTLEVTIYVPNEEKQINFPDLMVNNLEFYGLPKSQHLLQIFANPSNILPVVDHSHSTETNYIDILNTTDEHLDGDGPYFPQNPHTDDITDTEPTETERHPGTIGQQVHHGIPSGKGEKGPIDVDQSPIRKYPNGVDLNGKPVMHVINNKSLVTDYKKIIANYLNRPKQHVDSENFISGHDGHGPLNQPLEHNGKVLDLYDKTISPLDGTVENINRQDNQYPSNLNSPDTLGLPITDTVSPNRSIPEELKPTYGPHNTLDNMMVEQGFKLIKSVQKLLSGNKKNAIPPSVNLKPANSPVLDKWLVEEINHLSNSGPGASSIETVDLIEIKIRLLYVLEENGLHFTENGDLDDNHGHIFKISNLKLERVMISDPLVFKKLLGVRKCVMPYDIPYLEAVFVTQNYPPKVLGLIPLRLSTIPLCKGGKCFGKICNSKKEKSFIALLKRRRKLNVAPTYSTKAKNYQFLLSRMHSGEKNEVVSQIPPQTDLGVNDHHEGDNKTPPGDGGDDGLGTRIIGGHPATSSGTPVSSKGRIENRGSGQSLST